jgi:hypothetical protein
MVPLREDEELIDQLLEHNADFRRYLEKCLRGRSVPADKVLRRLK